ncbi:MAG: GNAT family N-acetyltransferase [Armatimonadota bacterium]|nr:GNAT family N-acetyltransferase [Armatimonadota bacterium]
MATIRTMRASDIGFGLELCRKAGWNQVDADWYRLLRLAPEGVFVAEEAGEPCGTASTTPYGQRTAWIGMVLVHPAFRRRGIGSALMQHCIRYLKGIGVQTIKLDATDQGRPVYLKLGFRDERPIHRYAGDRPAGAQPHPSARPLAPEDWPSLALRDEAAFGADRLDLLRLLAADGPAAAAGHVGEPRAYGFARRGYQASHLGPVVADDPETALSVIQTLLAHLPEGPVFWDLFPENKEARRIAESLGFTATRQLTRMYLGDDPHPGVPTRVFAATGFELG